MVEPLSATLVAVQFFGFAVQAAETISYIRRKFVGIKAAPKLIRDLHRELEILQETFSDLALVKEHVPEESRGRLMQMAEQLFERIGDLSWMTKELQINPKDPKVKQIWKAFITDERRPQLEEILGHIQRWESAIGAFLAGLNLRVTRSIQDQLTAHIAVVEPALDRTEASLSVVSTRTENIYTKTLQIEENIVESSAEIMRRMDRVAQRMSDDIPRLIEDGFQKCLQGASKDVLGLEKSSRNGEPIHGLKCVDSFLVPGDSDAAICSNNPATDNNTVSKIDSRIKKRCVSRPASRKRTFTRTFPLPIGYIQTSAVRCWSGNDVELLRLEISLIPFRWLSSHGRVMTMDKVSVQTCESTWSLTLRSYNIVSNNALILQACRQRDLVTIQKLFQYKEASPFDVDSSGGILMSHVFSAQVAEDSTIEQLRDSRQIIQFLINQGADPGPYVREFLKAFKRYSNDCRYWNFAEDLLGVESKIRMKEWEGILRLCLENSKTDPFVDTRVLLNLWENSQQVPCLDPSYLFQEDMAGLDDLVFEMPDTIFHDILSGGPTTSLDEVWQKIVDQNFENLVYLCRGGENSIKAKVFSKDFANSTTRPKGSGRSCYCPTNSTHLLFEFLHQNTILHHHEEVRASSKRKHARRMLIELLTSGEDPEARCGCKAEWQWPTGYRTVTDLAADKGLLSVWESALVACGFDAERIIEEWRWEGVPQLFEPGQEWPSTSELSQERQSKLRAPLEVIRTVVYLTLSSIV